MSKLGYTLLGLIPIVLFAGFVYLLTIKKIIILAFLFTILGVLIVALAYNIGSLIWECGLEDWWNRNKKVKL